MIALLPNIKLTAIGLASGLALGAGAYFYQAGRHGAELRDQRIHYETVISAYKETLRLHKQFQEDDARAAQAAIERAKADAEALRNARKEGRDVVVLVEKDRAACIGPDATGRLRDYWNRTGSIAGDPADTADAK